MSRAWITAAVVFFFLSCALGGLVMARFSGPQSEWKPTFGSPDAGR